MKIRGIDGQIREEKAGYILADGEAVIVKLTMMDAVQRAIAAGSPQALEDARQRAADAYERSRHEMQFEWMGDAGQAPPRQPASELSLAEINAQRDAGYQKSIDDMANAWRGEAA